MATLSHFFPLIIIIVVMILKGITAGGNQRSNPSRPVRPSRPSAPPETEEERMRRFMEAVGLPPGSTPPPQIQPRPKPQSRPLLPVNPPSTVLIPPGRLRRVQTAPPAQPSAPRPAVPPVSQPAQPAPVSAPAAPPPSFFGAPPPVDLSTPAEVAMTIHDINAESLSVSGAATAATVQTASPRAAALLRRLRDSSSVRDALVLREVLGPPKAYAA